MYREKHNLRGNFYASIMWEAYILLSPASQRGGKLYLLSRMKYWKNSIVFYWNTVVRIEEYWINT